MTMVALRNSDGSSLCHTLALKLGGKNHSVMDYSSYEEAQEIADRINDSGYVVMVTERNPKLYTVGYANGDRFDPEADYSDFEDILKHIG